ncbi:MAG: cation diffusion facilitator family transporter [Sorangiineae bacterium]|nr:cation diffusion facilitator family transporter [Sorangiineae bacterium]
MAHGSGDSRKVVLAALSGNAAIATAKFVAAFLSGSAAMLAEAVHSLADTANQLMLLIGMGMSRQRDPERYPLGRDAESYFWAFIVALMLFFVGGVYAIVEGAHKLLHPDTPGSPIAPLIVLGLSIVFEGASFSVAFREFQRSRGTKSVGEALFGGKDPTIPIVLLEDTAAITGLVVAFIAIGVSAVTGSTFADGVGSVIIGALLCAVGVALGRDTRSLLIGESATLAARARARELSTATPGVEEVTQLLSLHLGPTSVLLALKVRFRAGASLAEIERITDDLEARVRAELPQMKRIFVEADGDYDASLDPYLRPAGASLPPAPPSKRDGADG